jgi:hypothetical protein
VKNPILEDLLQKVDRLERKLDEQQAVSPPKANHSTLPSRDRCLIILNAPESQKPTSAERMGDDLHFLQCMVSRLFDIDEGGINVVTCFRLGRKSATPRPLKVVLLDEEECRRVLRRTFRLKGEGYFVVRDLSPEDRVKMRDAVKELKSRRLQGENDLHIVDFRVIQKRPRVGWKPVFLTPNLTICTA